MAATETIRIVLHTQATSGLCFPCTSEVYERSERSPPEVDARYLILNASFQVNFRRHAVSRAFRSQYLPRQPFPGTLSMAASSPDLYDSADVLEIGRVAGRCSDHRQSISRL